METPKQMALDCINQLPEDATWPQIVECLANLKDGKAGVDESVDWEGFVRRVKTILNDEFTEADTLKFEVDRANHRIRGYVISSEFDGMEDADRQDRVWDVLESNLSIAEQSRILSVLAYTPDERGQLEAA